MYNVEAMDIATAHQKVCKLVIEEGEYIVTEDKQGTFELPEPVAIMIRQPMSGKMRHPNNSLSEQAMVAYLPQILMGGNPHGFAYTYGDRLRNYPAMFVEPDQTITQVSFDQIDDIINSIQKNPTTRRAIGHTWEVGWDNCSSTPPCLQLVQVTLRGEDVNMVAYFRSNDMGDAWGSNAFGLAHMLTTIADAIGGKVGYLQTISTCAHIYEGQLARAKLIAYG